MALVRSSLVTCILAAVCCGCGTPARRALVDADAEFDRAVRLRSEGRHVAAAAAFAAFAKDYERIDPRADFAQFLAGDERLAAGHDEAAFEAFSELYRRFPGSAYLGRADGKCLEIGRRLLKAGDSAGAELLGRLADRAPYTGLAAEAHMNLGNHYYAKARFADARFEFDAAAEAQPNGALAAKAQLGAALCEYRQIDRPARNMDHVLAARERFRKLRTAPLSAAEMQSVDTYLKEVLDLAAERHLLMARFHLKQGEVGPALAYLREVLESYSGTRYYEPALTLMLLIEEESRKASK